MLCLAGLAACLQSVNLQTISAIGKSKTMFVWTVAKRIIGLCAMVGGLLVFGMKGLLVGVIINAWFSYIVNISLVSKHIGYKWSQQLLDILPVGFASVVAAVVAYSSIHFMHLNMYLDGALKLLVYVVIYLGWSFIFKPESYTYFLSIIPNKFKIWESKNMS